VPIGEWVIRQACLKARALKDAGHELTVAINISPRQLADPNLPNVLDAAISASGADPGLLCLEITEAAAVDIGAATLSALRDLDVRLALDDFGSGFSSLNQIRSMPQVDTIKIDRMFTEDLGRRPADTAIVSAIITMAAALEIETVAEGIETELQARLVTELGCDRAQGFHYRRPLTSRSLSNLLEAAAVAG
jgi:EAL domain-containing protein (putative c-di-GMP-specific phosphodiesterase class I)